MSLRIQLLAVSVLSLVAGAGAGVSLDRAVLPGEGCPHREALRGDAVERLCRDLELDAEQRARIEGCCAARREAIRAIQVEACGHLAEESRSLRAEVRSILTDEQRGRFDALARDLDAPSDAGCRCGAERGNGGQGCSHERAAPHRE